MAGEDKLVCFGVVNCKSLNSFAVAAVVELGQTKAADILTFYGPVVELFMERGGAIEKKGFGVEEIVEQTFSGHGSVVHRNSIGNHAEIQRSILQINIPKFPESHNHPGRLFPLLTQRMFLDIVLSEDMSIAIDKIKGGFDMIVKIALAEYDIFKFLSV